MQLFEKIKEYYINFYKQIFLSISNKKILISPVYKNSTTTRTMNSSATLKLSTKTEEMKRKLEASLEDLLKDYINSPQELIYSMKKDGMLVYRIKNASRVLAKIGEQEGFLTPLKWKKAIELNFILGILIEKKIKISFNTPAMFIFNEGPTEIYTIARALYKYYGYKNNMPGYDYKAQEIYKRVYKKNPEQKTLFQGFSLRDMYACKDAMARDLESINFTIKLSEKYEGAKKVLKKLKDDNSANI